MLHPSVLIQLYIWDLGYVNSPVVAYEELRRLELSSSTLTVHRLVSTHAPIHPDILITSLKG